MMKFQCPCCGHKTLSQEPPGTYEICPVCLWEDDDVQFRDPSFDSGANDESLAQARKNFKEFGASTRAHLTAVRPPRSDEVPDR